MEVKEEGDWSCVRWKKKRGLGYERRLLWKEEVTIMKTKESKGVFSVNLDRYEL